MPGPPIRKPSDHSPLAGSPRHIAGHHVLHRLLMPRHPPNAQKNKQQRHTNKTRNTLSQKSYSKMLASTIQFTTNPPTPPPTRTKTRPSRSQPTGFVWSGARATNNRWRVLPQNPDSAPPPPTQPHKKWTRPGRGHHQHDPSHTGGDGSCQVACSYAVAFQPRTTNRPAKHGWPVTGGDYQ